MTVGHNREVVLLVVDQSAIALCKGVFQYTERVLYSFVVVLQGHQLRDVGLHFVITGVVDDLGDTVLQIALGHKATQARIIDIRNRDIGIGQLEHLIPFKYIIVIAKRIGFLVEIPHVRWNGRIELGVAQAEVVARAWIVQCDDQFPIQLNDLHIRSRRAIEYLEAVVEKVLRLVVGDDHLVNRSKWIRVGEIPCPDHPCRDEVQSSRCQ